MRGSAVAIAALAGDVASIVLANCTTSLFGLVPVGFGLDGPAVRRLLCRQDRRGVDDRK
jgi:hypothetical protein